MKFLQRLDDPPERRAVGLRQRRLRYERELAVLVRELHRVEAWYEMVGDLLARELVDERRASIQWIERALAVGLEETARAIEREAASELRKNWKWSAARARTRVIVAGRVR